MKPTDILSAEHRVIEQVLNCLERMAVKCRKEGKLDGQSARDAIDFFRTFADRCHHAKEETHLFPAMEAVGFVRESGPTGVMLHEHEMGRRHVRAMDEAIDGAQASDPHAVAEFSDHALAYIDLLRQHIEKEDHCLFALANQALAADDQERLLKIFDRVESEELGEGTHDKYLRIADDLADRYGVARAEMNQPGHRGCGCGH